MNPDQILKILYIEDDPASKTLLINLFEPISQIEIKTAWSAEEGLNIAAEYHPNIIFLDINLPCMDGKAAYTELRSMDQFKHTKIIALSADAIPDHINQAMSIGFDKYITKPIDLQDILDTIKDIFPNIDTSRQ